METSIPRPDGGRDLDDDVHNYDRGLAFDLATLTQRRSVLKLFAGIGLAGIAAACGSDSDGSSSSSSSSSSARSSSSSRSSSSATAGTSGSSDVDVDVVPEETAGPYPGDGSNGPNVLTESGVVRTDITSSFGSSSTVAEGVPLTIEMTILTADDDTPVAGAAVYVWHCDREGRYSLYSEGVTSENYLRGVQEAGADGKVTFTSIFPACYSGRWPHVHFEVYESLDAATSGSTAVATSQLAFPEDTCATVYATEGYAQSVSNVSQVSLESDMVFSDDGAESQLATISGDVESGYTAALVVGI